MSQTLDYSEPKTESEDDSTPPFSEEEMLVMISDEQARAVGYENDSTLVSKRLTALNYYKGEMKTDIPSLENRSGVVSSDVADAVETMLPDLMEIFTGGGDVAAFVPTKPEDEDQAQQETDYLNHVLFQDNPGFLIIHSGFKDALLLNAAVFEYGWTESFDDEDFEGKSAQELLMASQSGKVINVQAEQSDETQEPTYSFTVRTDNSKAEYWAIPPDDFAHSADTIQIQSATYCSARYRPRVQSLIAEGYEKDEIMELETASDSTSTTQQARDYSGEHLGASEDANGILRQVEIRKHYLRLIDKSGDEDIWCLTTDAGATKLLRKDGKWAWKVQRIPFACGSPYLVSHRLLGVSLAEMLFEIQRTKTVLMRALLDSSYFALNQRNEVAMDQVNDYTISDLLRNEPGVPIRSKTGNAVRAIKGPGLGFDPYHALEYFSTVAEMRTGVVRNAQGLNPDTLHDTAKGALMMMNAAQRRMRMIARVLAETCLKDLYLGLHATIRDNASGQRILKLNGKWLPVDPTKWAERNAMSIEIGLGASGKDMDLAAMQNVIGLQKAGVELQGGAQGPVVKLDNLYQSAIDMTRKLGIKAVNKYFSDPSDPNNPPPPPQPSPEVMKIQGEMQLKQQTAQADQQHQSNKLQSDMQTQEAKLNAEREMAQMKIASEEAIQQHKAQTQAQVAQQQNQLEHEREMAKQQNELTLEQLRLASQERIAIEVARINAEAKISAAMASAKIDQQTTLAYEEQNEQNP
ncbi:MAG: hypothetical protein EPO02_13795 [Nitrospirae bacterium]|nr:MAG: hypothetical protein EPO02_13795 [Nitrospirota bacterium]